MLAQNARDSSFSSRHPGDNDNLLSILNLQEGLNQDPLWGLEPLQLSGRADGAAVPIQKMVSL